MNAKVGLWIDHRKAVIVSLAGEKEDIKLIESNVEKHDRFAEHARFNISSGARQGNSEERAQKRFAAHLSNYYDFVISRIRNAEAVLILGPGKAKSEFKKRLERNKLGGRIVGIEAQEKMSYSEIVAKVRGMFEGMRNDDRSEMAANEGKLSNRKLMNQAPVSQDDNDRMIT
jgi:hypothetical protein